MSSLFAEPFDIADETISNDYYHRVFRTTKYQQLTLRSLEPGEELPWEIHPNTTQFIRVESGWGYYQKGSEKVEYEIKDDLADVIVEGTWHRIYVPPDYVEPMKLYIIYSGEILHGPNEKQKRQHAHPITAKFPYRVFNKKTLGPS